MGCVRGALWSLCIALAWAWKNWCGLIGVCACRILFAVHDFGVCLLLPVCSMLGIYTLPWCENHYFISHESEIQESTRAVLRAALPWALRENPERCVRLCV